MIMNSQAVPRGTESAPNEPTKYEDVLIRYHTCIISLSELKMVVVLPSGFPKLRSAGMAVLIEKNLRLPEKQTQSYVQHTVGSNKLICPRALCTNGLSRSIHQNTHSTTVNTEKRTRMGFSQRLVGKAYSYLCGDFQPAR
jgi:hypothetical protein